MFKLFAFGIGAGAAVQAWRNFPADGPVAGDMVALIAVLGICCAYLGGRWHGRGYSSATATAVASAEATAVASNTVNVFTVMPGAGAAPVGYSMPGESAPWLTGEVRPELTLDQLDGMELSEFADEREHA